MTEMQTSTKKDTKIIGKNDKSAILVTDTTIRIGKKNAKKALNPLGIVAILPRIQLELGRNIQEFIKCLKMVRRPLAIQKIAENHGQATWNIIRLSTGKVPEARICTINTINDIIAAVSFNQELVYDTEFRKYEDLSVVHQMRIGKARSVGFLSNAVSVIVLLTGEEATSFKIKQTSKSIIVYTSIKGLENQYRFTFVKDKNEIYNLLSISFMSEKV